MDKVKLIFQSLAVTRVIMISNMSTQSTFYPIQKHDARQKLHSLESISFTGKRSVSVDRHHCCYYHGRQSLQMQTVP